ncbi:uncharacterized protein AC631_04158 [Debaryomyces fabryi]|uniref:Transcriptional regulatory protein RXT2 N-terminal domain-containing protein n=1 Tax=Debaryomyces fabryi TaxID=58627 RepID=A0A0V1PVK1_9ASCO|nr:uncharacterized protein AC631_04158 [Debaryomyces fabryi]KSA00076.1 hypothetical protein AC631_04158 [Debaryomyces fabryi]CUM47991.1 unnamed protein product [Debaryomyces fabryi]
MLDSHSLDVISRFKQSVLSKALPGPAPEIGATSRGNKITPARTSDNSLIPKIVEYEGSTHLVLTNDAIMKSTYRNKRRWHEMYGERDEESDSEEYEEEDDEDSDDEHPFKKLKLTEILSPLTHPSEIISHPAILKTYKLTIFNKMSYELIESIELEQNNLNWLNKLLLVLNGEDWFFLLEENLGLLKYDHGLNDDSNNNTAENDDTHEAKQEERKSGNRLLKHLTETNGHQDNKETDEKQESVEDPPKRITRTSTSQNEKESTEVNDPFFALPKTLAKYEAHQNQVVDENSDELLIIQEDLINYLQVSVQRQQEYIKNLIQIRNGLVRAERLKQDLHKWGKEMYDKKSS